MNNMVDKYDFFFKSIKEFTLCLDLVVEKDDSDQSHLIVVDALKEQYLCSSVKSFLSNFVTKVEFKDNGLGNAFFSYLSMRNCQQRVKERDVLIDILKVKVISGWEDRVANFENNELLFLKYDNLGSSYLFTDNNTENPILYLYWEGGDITSDDIVFTSYIRGVIFWELIRELQQLPNNPIIESIKWLQFYSWFYLNNKKPRNSLISWRYEFNRFLEKNQTERNHLLGVDEFEVEFIKFLIEVKGHDQAIDVFNPYSNIVTFRDYFNT